MRKILPVLTASVFVVGTSEYLVAGLLPQVAADLGVSVATAGQVVTAYAVGVVVGGPLVTLATVRVPPRLLGVLLLLLFAAGNALCALAPSYPVLVGGRVAAALSHAAFLTLALTVTTRVVPPARAGSAIALVASGFAAATLLGVPLGVLLGQGYGWRAPFAVLAVLAALASLAVAAALPGRPKAAVPVPGRPVTAAAVPEVPGVREEVRAVLRRPVLLVVATTAVGLAATSTVFTYLAPALAGITGLPPAAISALLLVYGVGSLFGGLAAGRLADRSLGATVRWTFAGLAAVLAAFPLALAWPGTAVPAVLAFGLLASATTPALQTLLLRHAAKARTLAIAVNVCAFNVGIAAGSGLGGGLVAAGWLRWMGLVAAALSLGALGLSYLAVPRSGEPGRPVVPGSGERERGQVDRGGAAVGHDHGTGHDGALVR